MKKLLKEIREDPNYVKLKHLYETTISKVDLEKIYDEAIGLHSGRLSRHLTGANRYSPKALIDANLRDLSYRARLVELRVNLDRKLQALQEMVEAVKRYVITEYADDLSDMKTVEQRRSFAGRVVKAQEQFLVEGKSMVQSLDTLIKDIDQASYHFKSIIDCLKLLDDKTGGKTI